MDTWQFIVVLVFAAQRMAYYCSTCDSLHREIDGYCQTVYSLLPQALAAHANGLLITCALTAIVKISLVQNNLVHQNYNT